MDGQSIKNYAHDTPSGRLMALTEYQRTREERQRNRSGFVKPRNIKGGGGDPVDRQAFPPPAGLGHKIVPPAILSKSTYDKRLLNLQRMLKESINNVDKQLDQVRNGDSRALTNRSLNHSMQSRVGYRTVR